MNADPATSIATADDRLLAHYVLRQKRQARLLCAEGHDMERRSSAHLGVWLTCTRCGLIEEHEPEIQLPNRIVVGANGAYWRDFGDDGFSMCPVSTDNDPIEPVAVYVRVDR